MRVRSIFVVKADSKIYGRKLTCIDLTPVPRKSASFWRPISLERDNSRSESPARSRASTYRYWYWSPPPVALIPERDVIVAEAGIRVHKQSRQAA